MYQLIDNNSEIIARGTKARMLAIAKRQREFDATYPLWLIAPNGTWRRVL